MRTGIDRGFSHTMRVVPGNELFDLLTGHLDGHVAVALSHFPVKVALAVERLTNFGTVLVDLVIVHLVTTRDVDKVGQGFFARRGIFKSGDRS